MSNRNATILALLAATVVFVFFKRHQPAVVLIATAFAIGYWWFLLCRRHPMVAIAIFGFLRGLLGQQAVISARRRGPGSGFFALIRA